MPKRAVRYAVVDAFTDEPFKGNTAAVCLVEEDGDEPLDAQWMQSVAAEFNTSITEFLVRDIGVSGPDASGAGVGANAANPRFRIRLFTPFREHSLEKEHMEGGQPIAKAGSTDVLSGDLTIG